MDFVTNTIIPYLFKGGLLTLATHYFGDIRRFVKSAMWQSVIQAIVLGLILLLVDKFLPQSVGNLTNLFKQDGGACGCGLPQVGGECAAL